MLDSGWSTAIRSVAQRWTDPDHEPRISAVEKTLSADNRFTEESLMFALNHGADLVARGVIERWIGDVAPAESLAIGIVSTGRTPLEGLFETVAASMVSAEVLVSPSPRSPVFLDAFFEEVAAESGDRRVRVVSMQELLGSAGAVLAVGDQDDREGWTDQLDAANVPAERRLIRPVRIGIAVLDGDEDRSDLSGLAEDLLLHEGGGPQNVRVVFAPKGLSPDALLEAMAGFREVFPPHVLTAGSFAMKLAYLEAQGVSLAVGPGFLVTRGEFDVQEGAHMRWVEYESIEDVAGHLKDRPIGEYFITSGSTQAEAIRRAGLSREVVILGFGDAHRPEIGQPPLTEDVPTFFRNFAID